MDINLDARELLGRAQQINPDLIARVMAEARADKLAELLEQAQKTQATSEGDECGMNC